MPQSLTAIYVHAVFSTKGRTPFLKDSTIRAELHSYIGGISNSLQCASIVVGGATDHVHTPARLARTISFADYIKEIKRVSSIFAKTRIPEFAWQAGYGAFSVDQTSLERVTRYINTQDEHHRTVSFQDELRQLMTEHGLEWDERYMWD